MRNKFKFIHVNNHKEKKLIMNEENTSIQII